MKKITEAELEQLEQNIWSAFLNQATATEIHQSVITSNWDGNSYLLNRIKDHPETDKATILIAYWMSAPRWMKQFSDREDLLAKQGYGADDFDLVEELEHKYTSGFFTKSNIAMDPRKDQDGYNWTGDYLDKETVREIPAVMFAKLEGETVARPDHFDEGLPMSPVNYAQQVYDLYDEYEVGD